MSPYCALALFAFTLGTCAALCFAFSVVWYERRITALQNQIDALKNGRPVYSLDECEVPL